MAQIKTKIEQSIDSKGVLVESVTEEIVGATSVSQLAVPPNARNVKKGIADGKATLTYDTNVENGGNSIAVSATASQEPLATHGYFQPGGKWEVSEDEWKQWAEWEKTTVPDPLPDELSDGFKKFIQLTQSGFTDFLQPRVIVRSTTTENSLPSLSKLGRIDSPSSAPSLSQNANWLLTSVEAQKEQGGKWSVTKEHTSSGAKGWNNDIYG